MGWFFHACDPMGGAAGEAYANTLKSPGMHPEHVLAREAIQNSVDAGFGSKVAVRFRASVITGAKKTAFVEHADLRGIAARAQALELAGTNCLQSLDKPKTPLRLLYVEDYNAEGLSGGGTRQGIELLPAPTIAGRSHQEPHWSRDRGLLWIRQVGIFIQLSDADDLRLHEVQST